MTENDALKLMKSLQISHDCEMVKTLDFKGTVIRALETLQQYRKIGTVEEIQKAMESMPLLLVEHKLLQKYQSIGTVKECEVAVKRMKPMSRVLVEGQYFCCCCGKNAEKTGHCNFCGQSLY